MNRWNIPGSLERAVIERDRACVYCRTEFEPLTRSREAMATWEHIVNDARIITRENIARCCASCNASKGAKPLICLALICLARLRLFQEPWHYQGFSSGCSEEASCRTWWGEQRRLRAMWRQSKVSARRRVSGEASFRIATCKSFSQSLKYEPSIQEMSRKWRPTPL
jgi:hypothetical protein